MTMLFASLDARRLPAAPDDRRQSVRYPVNAGTTCPFVLPVQQDVGPARVKDVSTDGIGLLLTSRVEPGALIAVGLTNPSRQFTRTLLVQVAHCTPNAGGGYQVGGTFLTPLTYEELRNVLM